MKFQFNERGTYGWIIFGLVGESNAWFVGITRQPRYGPSRCSDHDGCGFMSDCTICQSNKVVKHVHEFGKAPTSDGLPKAVSGSMAEVQELVNKHRNARYRLHVSEADYKKKIDFVVGCDLSDIHENDR